jgi:hypothetical protein
MLHCVTLTEIVEKSSTKVKYYAIVLGTFIVPAKAAEALDFKPDFVLLAVKTQGRAGRVILPCLCRPFHRKPCQFGKADEFS